MTNGRVNRYVIEAKTDKNIGTEAFARKLLSSWLSELPAELRPEYFDLGEPVRRSFEREGLERAVRMWVDNQMPLYLTHRTKPRMMVAMNWRPDKGKDPRPFPWGSTVWLARSAGDDLALTLFRFLTSHFEPAFGSVSTEEDSRTKHRLTWEDPPGTASQYMGLDVGRFVSIRTDYGREVLPGVYWITYFGPGARAIVGERAFDHLRASTVEKLGDGCLVRAYPSSSEAGTPTAHQAEAEIMDQLGRQHFFDKAKVDVEALKTDEVTAARVERKIEEIKKARK
jgi:hypothetical protein